MHLTTSPHLRYERSFDHFDALLLESLVPLFLLVGAWGLTSAHKMTKQAAAQKSHRVLEHWLTALFLILPVISRRICSSFRCTGYDWSDDKAAYGFSYLKTDSSLDCTTDRYWAMFAYATAMVAVYPIGAPLVLLLLLWRYRYNLNPPFGNLSEVEVIAARKEDPVLAEEPLTDFSMLYRPAFWWFEVYNMVRRLLLTCAVLLCRDLGETTVFVVFVAIITLVIEQESKPYVNVFLSAFTHVCCWQILLFVLYLQLLDSGATTGDQAIWFSAALMLANVGLIATIFM